MEAERLLLLEHQKEAERLRLEEERRRAVIKHRFSVSLGKLGKQSSMTKLFDAIKLVEAKRLWRKCIRAAIRVNRQKNSAVGVLKYVAYTC